MCVFYQPFIKLEIGRLDNNILNKKFLWIIKLSEKIKTHLNTMEIKYEYVFNNKVSEDKNLFVITSLRDFL